MLETVWESYEEFGEEETFFEDFEEYEDMMW